MFVDTNLLLDILEERQPHYADSYAVLERCESAGHRVFMAWHGLATAFYIYSRKAGPVAAQKALQDALDAITVATTGHAEARHAFALGFHDFEDALQAVAAECCAADLIVTRNASDFSKSPVPAITPADFLARHPVA